MVANGRSVVQRTLRTMAVPIWDGFNDAFLRMAGQKGFPPLSLRRHVGPPDRFLTACEEHIAYFKLLGGLRMDDTVLDIGCGIGRFALRLVGNPHFFHGQYYGFDPDPRCIRWATANIAKPHPNVHFTLIDLRNSRYNPSGQIDPATYRFPFDENSFDFAFAYSIFTHLLPPVTINYLHEIGRVLKPGKMALLTCTLLDGYPESLRKDIIANRGLVGPSDGRWHHRGDYSVRYPDEPEKVTAYQRRYFLDQIRAAGLEVVRTYSGCWNELEDYLSEQDIVVVAKPSVQQAT